MNLRHLTERVLITAAMLIISSTIHASAIDVGGVALEIPNPVGFTAIAPNMTAIYDFQTKFWPESAVHYLTFIQDSETPIALKNEIPEMNRRLAVTAIKDTVNITVRNSDFADLKKITKAQYEQLVQQAREGLPNEMQKQSKRMSEQGGQRLKFDMPQSVPYLPHEVSERSFAFSSINNYTVAGTDGGTTYSTVSMTSTYLHVRGKLLVLHVHGEKDELDWTRTISKQWSDSILAANPPDERSIAAEAPSNQSQGIDWMRVVLFSVLAYLIGGAGGFVWHKFFKKKVD